MTPKLDFLQNWQYLVILANGVWHVTQSVTDAQALQAPFQIPVDELIEHGAISQWHIEADTLLVEFDNNTQLVVKCTT